MLVSELADRADVPLATVKYYLREGLLPPGETVGPRRAEYDETHLRRLRVLRALREVGGAPVSALQVIVDGVEDDSRPSHEVLCEISDALSPPLPEAPPGSGAVRQRGRRDRRDRLERRPPGRRRPPPAGRGGRAGRRRAADRQPGDPGLLRPPRRRAVPDRDACSSTSPRTARARSRTWSSARRSSARSSPCSAGSGTSTTTSSDVRDRRGGRSGWAGQRTRTLSWRQIAAAVARFRLSARPGIGIRTRWSARAASSAGSPHASLPKSQAIGPARIAAGVGQRELARPVRGQHDQPGRLRGDDRRRGVGLDADRQVEDAADARAHGLGVVEVDGVAGQHDRVGPQRVGGADEGAGVAGLAHVGSDHHQRRSAAGGGERRLRRDVEERAHGDDPGRGHAVAERGQGTVVDQGDARAPAPPARRTARRRRGSRRPRRRSPPRGRPRRALGPSARNSRRSVRTERRLSLRASLTRRLPTVKGVIRGLDRLDRRWARDRRPQEALGALTSSGRAALAVSTSTAKAGASLTARSARILRSTSTPARLSPWMKRL